MDTWRCDNGGHFGAIVGREGGVGAMGVLFLSIPERKRAAKQS